MKWKLQTSALWDHSRKDRANLSWIKHYYNDHSPISMVHAKEVCQGLVWRLAAAAPRPLLPWCAWGLGGGGGRRWSPWGVSFVKGEQTMRLLLVSNELYIKANLSVDPPASKRKACMMTETVSRKSRPPTKVFKHWMCCNSWRRLPNLESCCNRWWRQHVTLKPVFGSNPQWWSH